MRFTLSGMGGATGGGTMLSGIAQALQFTETNVSVIVTSPVRPPNGGRNEANSDIDTG